MKIADIRKQTTDKMAKSVDTLKHDLAKVRTGRAHPGLIDHLRVDYYGSEVPINQVGNVTLADARTISIQPFEKKMVQVIEKAIRDSDLGVNPATSGDVIRIPMPALTEERRRDLVKHIKKLAEDYRVSMRNHRRDGLEMLKELEKDHEITEDDRRHGADKIEVATKESIERIEKVLKQKEDEIMAV